MPRDEEERAIRFGVAWSEEPGWHVLAVRGDQAFEAVDAVSTSDLYLQDAQLKQTLFLNEDATPFSDIVIGRDDETYLILADGPSSKDTLSHFAQHAAPFTHEIVDLGKDHAIVSLHGPYAWELAGDLLGPDAIGMPYLTLFRIDDILVFRAGRTGEYGYDLLVPRERLDAFRARLLDVGARFDLTRVGREALSQCSLENWFFDIHRDGRFGLTPLELQLQWRLSPTKAFPGSAALAARREAGISARVTCAVSPARVAEGDIVMLAGNKVGNVLAAGFSETRRDWVLLALIDMPFAHAGIDAFEIAGEKIRTMAPPLLNNRSLWVNPQRHTYEGRDKDVFPEVAPA